MVTPENRPHHISILVPILVIASKITGDSKYRDALTRFDKIVDDYANGQAEIHFNLCSLMVEGFHLALQEGHEDPRYRESIRQLWNLHQQLILDEGFGRWTVDSPMKTSEVTRMSSLAPVVDHYFPETEAYRKAIFILNRVNDPRTMLYVTDTCGQPTNYHGPLEQSICELAITSWLVGYWRLRKAGVME